MTKTRNRISLVVNICNEASTLAKCLSSAKDLADETIVIDMESTDNGVEIARRYGAQIFPHRPTKVVEESRNFAISKCTSDWVLILDPDEYISAGLKKELQKLSLRHNISFVKIPRKNIIFGKWLRHSQYWPDYLIRFFRPKKVKWLSTVHSQPITEGHGHTLPDNPEFAIRHNNYQSINQFLSKAIRYAESKADELDSQNYKLRLSDLLIRPVQEFNSRFYAGQEYRDGFHGLIISILQSISILLIYLFLWDRQRNQDKTLSKESYVSSVSQATFEFNHWHTKFLIEEHTHNLIVKLFYKLRYHLDRLTRKIQ